MLLRTHYLITLFGILVLFSYVENKIIFVVIALIATALPDADSPFTKIGNRKISKILQVFTKHRGIIHSFTFLFSLTLIFVFFIPQIALGFFLGYSLHLFADCFTFDGIYPFWPLKAKSSWRISTGEKWEKIIFILFAFIDAGMIIGKFL